MNDSFLKSLANPEQPIPGGGAAAAHAALVGLALLHKIVGVERRRSHDNREMISFWEGLSAKAADAARRLQELRDEDGASYMRFADTRSAGKNKAEISEAAAQAIACPAEIMETAAEAVEIVLPAIENCRNHLLSDLMVAAELLGAASRGARHIVQANLRDCDDPVLKAEYQKRLTQIDTIRDDALGRVADALRKRGNAK
jgi:formiminotetrahydrofolate cyclodeaminase